MIIERKSAAIGFGALGLAAMALCVSAPLQGLAADADFQARVTKVLKQTPLIDGHNDLPWEIRVRFKGQLAAIDLASDTSKIAPPPDEPATFEIAYTAADVRRIHKSGKIASLIGIEGGHQINDSLAVLRQMYDLGARYMTLTHSLTTDWADSATDAPMHHGLTAFGIDVIHEMNRIGMLIDLSH